MASAIDLKIAVGELLAVVREVSAMEPDLFAASSSSAPGSIGGDCVRLARKISLLSHLAQEIEAAVASPETKDLVGGSSSSSSRMAGGLASCLDDFSAALEAARNVLMLGRRVPRNGNVDCVDMLEKDLGIQLQYVTWQLEKVLGEFQYAYFNISDEVQEQVELVRAQLKRATEKSGTRYLKVFSEVHNLLSRRPGRGLKQQRTISSPALHIHDGSDIDCEFDNILALVAEVSGRHKHGMASDLMGQPNKADNTEPCNSSPADEKPQATFQATEENKKPDSLQIPEDFRCPISLELMKDPVIVSTGQTYERSFIKRWIDCGNRTCPKTQQKLQNLTLTPNYVLRSLIMQWCELHKIEQPPKTVNGWFRKSDGTFHEFTGDRAAIEALVKKLSGSGLNDKKSAAAEIRSLAKRSTDNRILLAEAGAIPALVKLLSAEEHKLQEHAVTALLNLSIYDHNKELIVLAGAVVHIIGVLRNGSMEARENAAATIFSLSLIDENKITIGSTPGAMDALIELLYSGSPRGKKDAATALFNLCIYQGNKARAVRAGILSPLIKMLQDPVSHGMIDEALTIISVIVGHHEGKAAITKAHAIPLLIDLLRTGQPRTKENAAAILLALCKKDDENLACIGRLGALIPLTELAKSGTERAKRKATSLLEHLSKLQML